MLSIRIANSLETLSKRKTLSVVQLEATGATILKIDYLDESSISDAAKEFGSGKLDVLVNCAGLQLALRWYDYGAISLLNCQPRCTLPTSSMGGSDCRASD